MKLAGTELESDTDFRCAFYGNLFGENRKRSAFRTTHVSDVDSDWEKELLQSWWQETERVENNHPNANSLLREKSTQKLSRELCRG
ncbi:MAG UNVERIFIED_CONTAM: hypothetical protein LVR29_16805 [Microcystis novacekii LVE1205-3]